MESSRHPAVLRGVFCLALAWLAGGCEIEAEGGGERVQWQLSNQLRDPEDRPNPDVEIVYVGSDTAVSVRP